MTFEEFFDAYVVNFMLRDVSRELAMASRGEDAGNFLAALGLLTYTEVMGSFVPGVGTGKRQRFDAFFGRLGPCYAAQLPSNPYRVYRCGMVHSYLVEGRCEISMFDAGTARCGLFKGEDGWHHLIVDRYFEDFVVACDRLHRELAGHRHPLIHTYAPNRLP